MALSELLLVVLFLFCSSLSARAEPALSSFPLTPHLIHEFPKETYLSSIAVRKRDGDIVLTVATTAEIFLISTDKQFKPVKLATLPGVEAAIGIVEACVDEFYIVGGNLSVTENTATAGSFSIWRLEMRTGNQPPNLTRVADIEGALLLDRVTQLDSETLLVSDTILGVIWSLNIGSGESHVVLNDTATMSPVSPSGVGVNYIHTYGNFIYYDNSEKGLMGRIPIDPRTVTATGPPEIFFKNNETLFPQGFTFRGDELWLASAINNQVLLISNATSQGSSSPSIKVVASHPNDTRFAGLTDCKFGSKPEDLERGSLYVTPIGKVGDTWTFGGSLWRLDVGPYSI